MWKFLLVTVGLLLSSVCYGDDSDTVSQYVRLVLENLRKEMHKGIPQMGIPVLEPFTIPELDVPQIKEGIVEMKLNFKNLIAKKFSTFQLRYCRFDMNTMKFAIQLFFPHIPGTSDYKLNGKVLIFPLYGDGPASANLNDFLVSLEGTLLLTEQKLSLSNLKADATFSAITLRLENLLGGNNLGEVVNAVINILGKKIFDMHRGRIMSMITNLAGTALNKELEKVNLDDILGGIIPFEYRTISLISPRDNSANNYIDKVMENLRPHILQNNLDPVGIPDVVASFSKKILLITVYGSAKLYNGWLRGLSTIHRSGDCSVGSSGSVVSIGCNIGLDNLFGEFDARAEFMGIGVGASAKISVPAVRVYAKISQDMSQGSPRLDQFSITTVSAVGVTITGLGPLDWILTIVSNIVVNSVKQEIISAIEHPIRQELSKVIESINIEL